MHRVNIQSKRTVILRIVAYAVTVMLSVATTAVLLFIAMGYRFNSKGAVVQSGLLLVDNKPEAAQIYLNDTQVDSQSPGRFVLPVGTYKLSLGLDGYRGWQKHITMKAEYVEQAQYPLLIPTTLTSLSLLPIAKPSMVSQSNDNKTLLYFVPGETVLHSVKLDPKQPVQTDIVLSNAFSRESGSVGSISVLEWSLKNKHVLLNQVMPSGKTSIISLNLDKPAEAVNITTSFSDIVPTDVHYEGGKTDSIYGLHEGVLRRYDIANTSTSKVLDRVISYQNYGDNTVAFTRFNAQKTAVESGVTDQRNTAVLESTTDVAVRPLVSYAEYSGRSYFVVAGKTDTHIYRDPLVKPILRKQIPFVKLVTMQPSYIKFSRNNGYVFVQSGTKIVSFDFENVRRFSFDLPGLTADTHPTWMNDSHLAYSAQDQTQYLLEFDGANKEKMVSADTGTRLYYSSDQKSVYSVVTTGQTTALTVTSLVAK